MSSTPDSVPDRAVLDHQATNALRFLAVDMVEAANSGHPGAPMGQAAMAYTLWSRHLVVDPGHPTWWNRDRFVLSCGHASALLYGLLHLAGYELELDDLRAFRQLGSRTPGHPENRLTAGVETTTGPLGQGLGNAVGMAIAERMLGSRFNRPGCELFHHRIWVIASDGDVMEGVGYEASSLAGHLGLGKLNVLYDANEITIDGPTSLAFSEDVGARYAACGWHVEQVDDGNDFETLDAAMRAAVEETSRPSLIVVCTHIGYGSPAKQDTSAAHGAPLGEAEVRATKTALGWPLEPTFHVPDEARQAFAVTRQRGAAARRSWDERWQRYRVDHPEAAAELERRMASGPSPAWLEALPTVDDAEAPAATRQTSGRVLNCLAATLPELVGGSADLAGSNNTTLAGSPSFSASTPEGRNLRFGVREHGMGAIANGIALAGAFRPYVATFLVFSDYMRAAVRLAALMRLPVVYVYTHDSVFLGEDGPTHQPVSQLLSLRALPGLVVLRPADARETVAAWRLALERTNGPTALVLTRQKLPVLAGTTNEGVARGAYVVAEASAERPELILLATGSEVAPTLGARLLLEAEGVPTRVVSVPSWERFEEQTETYREQVLPSTVWARLAIEALSPLGWHRYVGARGAVFGLDRFGESAPCREIAEELGFTAEGIARRARAVLDRVGPQG